AVEQVGSDAPVHCESRGIVFRLCGSTFPSGRRSNGVGQDVGASSCQLTRASRDVVSDLEPGDSIRVPTQDGVCVRAGAGPAFHADANLRPWLIVWFGCTEPGKRRVRRDEEQSRRAQARYSCTGCCLPGASQREVQNHCVLALVTLAGRGRDPYITIAQI